MNEKSRTEYSAVNSTVAVVARMSAILLGFFARVVFTHTLNEDYVGINGLFGNILNYLCFVQAHRERRHRKTEISYAFV